MLMIGDRFVHCALKLCEPIIESTEFILSANLHVCFIECMTINDDFNRLFCLFIVDKHQFSL